MYSSLQKKKKDITEYTYFFQVNISSLNKESMHVVRIQIQNLLSFPLWTCFIKSGTKMTSEIYCNCPANMHSIHLTRDRIWPRLSLWNVLLWLSYWAHVFVLRLRSLGGKYRPLFICVSLPFSKAVRSLDKTTWVSVGTKPDLNFSAWCCMYVWQSVCACI